MASLNERLNFFAVKDRTYGIVRSAYIHQPIIRIRFEFALNNPKKGVEILFNYILPVITHL